MDTHTESPVAVAPAVEQIPDASPEPESFSDAIDIALSKLSGETPATPEPEPAADPAAEPAAETAEVQPEKSPEEQATEKPDADATSEPEESSDENPLESLTEDVGDWTPKAASRFKQLKSELKSNTSELENLKIANSQQEQKIKEMSGLVENRDIDQLQNAVADYEYDRAFENLEETAAYQQAVTEPLSALMEQANQLASHYDVSEDVVLDIIAGDDAEAQEATLQQHFGEASDRDKAALYRIIDTVAPILNRRQELYNNVEAALNEANVLEEQRQNQAIAEQAQFRTDVTRNVVERVNEKLPFLSGVEGLDMKAIEAKAAETDPTVVHPVDFAYNAVAAQLLPTVVREYLTARKEAEALTDKLAEYEGAEPTMSGIPAADGSSRASADMSFEEAINAALG